MRPEIYAEIPLKITLCSIPDASSDDKGWLVKIEQEVWDEASNSEVVLSRLYMFTEWTRLISFLEDELI